MTPADILHKIDLLPVTEWNYKNEGPSIKHIGPVAQDFYALFQVGNSSTSISTIDPGGIALLGIQALDQKIMALQGSLTENATATNLSVYAPSNFSGDCVGEAKILTGQTSVRITFSQPYQYQPIVTATPLDFVSTPYRVTDIEAKGFTIQTQTAVASDTTFDWHSFASPDQKLFVSNGSTVPIVLILPPSPPSAPPVTGPAAAGSPSSTPDSTASSSPEVLGVSTSTPPSSADSTSMITPSNSPSTTPPTIANQSSSTTNPPSDLTSSPPAGAPPITAPPPASPANSAVQPVIPPTPAQPVTPVLVTPQSSSPAPAPQTAAPKASPTPSATQ